MEKVLVLGGTQFIGRNLVERLLKEDKYEITLFNRGVTGANLFPNTKQLKGDRETDDIEQIAQTHWDYIIDASCFYPSALQSVLSNINKPKKYVFISTCSVYQSDNLEILKTENAPVLSCTKEQAVDRTDATYGNRKIACEELLKQYGINYTILRPALVYGRYDYTDRLYYWLHQAKTKRLLLMPDNGERKFSVTYVHHLVDTILQSLNKDSNEAYNVITQPQTSIKEIVDIATDLFNKIPSFITATPQFLAENKITQWMDMPLWIDGDHFTYSNQKLLNDFSSKPTQFKQSIFEAIEYYDTLLWHTPTYGIGEERRQQLIELLKAA